MKLSKLLFGVDLLDNYIPDTEIDRVTAKVDLIDEDTLFILFDAIRYDTKKVIDSVFSKNPRVVITDLILDPPSSLTVIRVKDARRAYAQICYNFCEIDERLLKFFAVTGTCGKTTTATMLYNLFTEAKIKCGFIGTGKILIGEKKASDLFYSMTTPDPELLYPMIKKMQNEGCQNIVMEVSSHALSLRKVAPIRFECSLFTNLSDEHMDFHKDKEEYFHTKLSLFSQSNRAIFNLDDEYGKRGFLALQNNIECYGVAIKSDADAVAGDIWYKGFKSTAYTYKENERAFKVKLSCVGEYNISNSLLAIKCALTEGVPEKVIREALALGKKIEGRFETISKKPQVIIDYAHTEAAMKSILSFIKSTRQDGQRIITVFGCGGERDKEKRPKMAMISEIYSDFSIVTSDNSRKERPADIISDIEAGFIDKAKYTVIENREDAIRFSVAIARESDIVVIIGKGHERYNIDSEGYHNFDERSIILNAVKERNPKENANKNRHCVDAFAPGENT